MHGTKIKNEKKNEGYESWESFTQRLSITSENNGNFYPTTVKTIKKTCTKYYIRFKF
jgi:hypothetical protein